MAQLHPGEKRPDTPLREEEEQEPRPRRHEAPGRSLARPAALPERRFRRRAQLPGAGDVGSGWLDLPAAGTSPAGARSRPRVLRFPGSVADASQTLGGTEGSSSRGGSGMNSGGGFGLGLGFGLTPTTVIQVTNLSSAVTSEQMRTLFSFLGEIEELRLYPPE